MSADADVGKSLAKWLTKAKTIAAPPGPNERRGTSAPGEKAAARSREPIRQLNLKISESTYARIKGLAYRDRLSLVAMLDEMVSLYEKAHGKFEK
jgi:hypothetical protein